LLEKRTSLRKNAPKQADYEELAYDEKGTIYTKTAKNKRIHRVFLRTLFNHSAPTQMNSLVKYLASRKGKDYRGN
jgi:hypothetical protein